MASYCISVKLFKKYFVILRKHTIIVVMLFAQTYFGFEVPLGPILTFGPAVIALLFALPCFVSSLRQGGIVRGLLVFISVGLLGLGFAMLASKVGLPYGKITYTDALGHQVFGAAPWVIAVIYPSMVLAVFWLVKKLNVGFLVPVLTGLFLVLIDLVLDPAAVKLEFWQWDTPGFFYGVPIVNLIGWFLGGFIASWLANAFWGNKKVTRGLAMSGLGILLFWTGANIGIEQWFSAAIGGALSVLFLLLMFFEKRAKEG
jgi:putative membrane protein